jgi:flagellar basal-body rod modification protein FlgD
MAAAVSNLNTTPATAPSSADPIGSDSLGKDDFLKLLLAQLANQDPTAPSDNQAFVAELAQFSSLEAAQGTNTRLDTMLAGQASSSQTSAAGLIGKQIDYRTDVLNLQAGMTATSQASLAASAAKVSVSIIDATGKVVRTMALGPQAAGILNVSWDGNDDTGNREPPGTYSMTAAATDTAGNGVTVGLSGVGEATGVAFSASGAPQLNVNGTLVPMSQVTSINERIKS